MIAKYFSSVFTRILFTLIFIFSAFGLLTAVLFINSSRTYEQEVTQQIHRDLAQHVVDNYLLYNNGKPDYEAAKKTFHDLMILGANFEFYLLNKHGEIVAFDAKPEQVKAKSIALGPIQQFLKNKARNGLIQGDDPRYADKKKIFSVAPIIQMGEVYGYLYVVIGSQARDALEQELWSSKILYSGLWIFIGASLLTLLALVCVIAFITRPLSKLTHQVQLIREQGFEKYAVNTPVADQLKTWRADSNNDIHILGHSFQQAIQKLHEQYDNLVSIDDLRKELLSHVSHDLRTPLASLLGYLETWEMQHEILPAEKGAEYISTAKRSAQKISILIEQLFELAHLDGNSVTVKKEPIAIAELVQDVLGKFTLNANKKSINLSVTPQDSSIIVRADIEKLERVFTNLIENALRHTQEGGSIQIKIEKESGFASIQVSDTGIGIPEQDLPFVFDPHFKAGNSVRENTAHGGLGLAITKKLLELHESAISVNSKINKGTTFSFALPS